MSLTSDLVELSQQLQHEHLFVTTEKESLMRLFHNVSLLSERIFHTAWIARQQKLTMQEFIDKGTHPETPVEAYSATNQVEDTNFIDSYKVFSYHETKYVELMKFLYENPSLLCATIIAGENCGGMNIKGMISMTVTSIYGHCLFHEDEQNVLLLLKYLLDVQVANSDNPRRLIRRQNTSFSLVYKHLCDSLFSAKLFLTAALYEPIMRLLMEDEWFFDIDPDKALVRFPQKERLRRFGEPGTQEYKDKLAQYRNDILYKLVMLAERFIKSIKANIHCFPPSLGWLVSQVYRVLTERGQVSMQEVRASCADLVFALFICPAICDPEPHGITSDVPISHIARHNLMQMAQIIQVLAISQPEDIDVKTRDLYTRFDASCMASVLDLFLEGPWEDMTEQIIRPSPSSSSSPSTSHETSRSGVMLTSSDMRELIAFLRATCSKLDDQNPLKKSLEQILSSLPTDMPPSASEHVHISVPGGSGVITPTLNTQQSLPEGSTERKKLFNSRSAKKKRDRAETAAPTLEEVLPAVAENESNSKPKPPDDVLVVSMYGPGDCPGMLPEKKVFSALEAEASASSSQMHSPPTPTSSTQHTSQVEESAEATPPPAAPAPEIQEKRTRFSLSHDQESIGNASDYQEVISEAASSHSVEDEENELETDNFSDMMSANVSGRGSPSVSGRDTPLSQAESVEENIPAPAVPQLPVPVPETARKQNRVDVTDRFGKFEIKPELGMERDECKSTVSDTWSTDVLASDSEPPDVNHVDRLQEVAEEILRPPGIEPLSEISETASDAWSTDVLAASDTDEKHSDLLKDLELDLNSVIGDREEADSSVGQDDGFDNLADLDPLGGQIGAVGGSHSSTTRDSDAFPDVFSEPLKSEEGAERSSSGGRKVPNIAYNFNSGPNLQLPSSNRSMSHFGRNEGSGGNVGLSPSASQSVHSSTGARSKVRDKDSRRREDGFGIEFDPLSSDLKSSKSGKSRGQKQNSVEFANQLETGPLSSTNQGGELFVQHSVATSSPSSSSGGPNNELPTPPIGQSRSGSRDSGIDIWVNTNGQMSGNSSHSQTRTSAPLMPQVSIATVSPPRCNPSPGRASLDSNLQRITSPNAGSTPDSGLHSMSFMPGSMTPLKLSNPLFNFPNTSQNPPVSSFTPTGSLVSQSSSLSNSFSNSGTNLESKSDILMQFDTLSIDTNGDRTSDNANVTRNTQGTPQIQVTDMFNVNDGSSATNMVGNSVQQQMPSSLIPPNSLSGQYDSSGGDSANLLKSDADDAGFFPINSLSDEMDETKKSSENLNGHRRQDSSGSSQSANSYRLNTSSKEPSVDNMSIYSTDSKDVGDGEDASGNKSKRGRGIFGNIKDKFNKGIKKKGNTKLDRQPSGVHTRRQDTQDKCLPLIVKYMPDPETASISSKHSRDTIISAVPTESTEDILAKYRSPKKSPDVKAGNNNSSVAINNNTGDTSEGMAGADAAGAGDASRGSSSGGSGKDRKLAETSSSSGASAGPQGSRGRGTCMSDSSHNEDIMPLYYDKDNIETCPAFEDTKRKLRMVLSTGDVYLGIHQVQSSSPREGSSARENELLNLLQAQLAEAINLQNKDVVAQLYEVIRCVKLFDMDGCKLLLQSMQEDYRARSSYISYLIRCRQCLLASKSHLQRLLNRVNRDKEICSKHLTNICARQFLEKREKKIHRFIADFQKLSMSDEKVDLVEQFLLHLYEEMSTDVLWRAATDPQLEDGKQSMERFLMNRIYTHAMFPNGEGDIMRDQLLQEHLRKLNKVISPTHKALCIPQMYHAECPWPAAQKEIYMINAYRTPRDKIQCVLRCSKTIMNLLSMANPKSVPAADDFMPVLIFVLIKANPKCLLSTIQYVNSFYDSRMHGEEHYWWLQLTSAVEFIKTLEYHP